MNFNRRVAWAMWLIASLFYAYQYVLRVMPNVMVHDIMGRFKMGPEIFGQFSGAYYMSYSLAHILVGIMLDRVGPKKVIPCLILIAVLGLAPLLTSDSAWLPILGRVLMGIGSSGAILGVFKVIRICFQEGQFTRYLSFSVTIGLVGAIYGGMPVHFIREAFGYENVLILLMLLGTVLAAATYFLIPGQEVAGGFSQQQSKKSIFQNVLLVFQNTRVLLLCILAGLMVGPLEGFADVWATKVLKEIYHLPDALATSIPSLVFIGMGLGGPLLSWISEKFKNHLQVIFSCAILMAVCLFGIISGKLPSTLLISIAFFILGVCCAYQILAIYRASTYVAEDQVGLTTAIANMIIMLFGYVFHSLIGFGIRFFNSSTELTNSMIQPEALRSGIMVVPFALMLAALGLWFCFNFLEGKKKLHFSAEQEKVYG